MNGDGRGAMVERSGSGLTAVVAAHVSRAIASFQNRQEMIDQSWALLRATRRRLLPAGVRPSCSAQPQPAGARAGLSTRDRDTLVVSSAYEVGPAEVARDAGTVVAWQGPADELLVHLCGRHAWLAEMGVFYLAALRQALHLSPGSSPWSSP